MSSPVLEVEQLSKTFKGHLSIGRKQAVKRVDFSVRSGEVMGLLGPNGAGKTTTMKMILGLLKPDHGTIRIFERSPQDKAARARIGFLPENPYFYDHLTAVEFLDLYARLHDYGKQERKRRVGEALKLVGMWDRKDTPMRKCSKGMTQRIGLAQAIQHDPDLVILDEPMSGLDPVGRREVRDLILKLKSEGKTVLFSSHILQDAEMLCDHLTILNAGSSIFSGSMQELGASGVQFYEVALIGGQHYEALPGRFLSMVQGRLLMRCDSESVLAELLTGAIKEGWQVDSIWPKRDSLETMFLKRLKEDDDSQANKAEKAS